MHSGTKGYQKFQVFILKSQTYYICISKESYLESSSYILIRILDLIHSLLENSCSFDTKSAIKTKIPLCNVQFYDKNVFYLPDSAPNPLQSPYIGPEYVGVRSSGA